MLNAASFLLICVVGALYEETGGGLGDVFVEDVCLFGCEGNGCPCDDVCKHDEGDVMSDACQGLLFDYCCMHRRRDIACVMFGRWDIECLPWPVEATTYMGTKGVTTSVFATGIIASTPSEMEYPDTMSLGESNWELSTSTCGAFPWAPQSLNGWVPQFQPSQQREKEEAFGTLALSHDGPTILLSIEPLLDITGISAHEVSSMGDIESITLLSTPVVANISETSFYKQYEVYSSPGPPEAYVETDGTPGVGYHGNVDTTTSGLRCLSWGHKLFRHPYMPYEWSSDSIYAERMMVGEVMGSYQGDGVGEHNYCRNPDGDPKGAWCYVWDESDTGLGLPPVFPGSQWEYDPTPLKQDDMGGGPDPGTGGPGGGFDPGPDTGGPGGGFDPGPDTEGPDGGFDPDPDPGGFNPDPDPDPDPDQGGFNPGPDPDQGGDPGPDTGQFEPGQGEEDTQDPTGGQDFGGTEFFRKRQNVLSRQARTLDCMTPQVAECLKVYAEMGCTGVPYYPDFDCSVALQCTAEVQKHCGTQPKACEDDVEVLRVLTGDPGMTCEQLVLDAATGAIAMVEAIALVCNTHREGCCKYCLTYGYGNPAVEKKILSNTFPPSAVGKVLVWAKFKHYCTIPDPQPCLTTREQPVTVSDGGALQVVTAVRISMKPSANTYKGVDSIAITGTVPSGCHDDNTLGHWQEPLCVTCKATATEVWKGPECTTLQCNAKKCDYGFCDAADQCKCYRGYAGPTCGVQCPLNATAYFYYNASFHNYVIPRNENTIVTRPDQLGYLNEWTICSGNGVCDDGVDGDGSCMCDPGFAGPNCSEHCPGMMHGRFGIVTCSGRGKCYDGAQGNATCECWGLYFGDDCSKVLCDEKECHNGVCLDPVTEEPCALGGKGCYCACYGKESYSLTGVYKTDQPGLHGYWDGGKCDKCQENYGGDECNERDRQSKTYKGEVKSGSKEKFGPVYFEPCTELNIEFTLLSGDEAQGEVTALGGWGTICYIDLNKDKPIEICTPDASTIQQFPNSIIASVTTGSITTVSFSVGFTYAARCLTACGDHGLCSDEEQNFNMKYPEAEYSARDTPPDPPETTHSKQQSILRQRQAAVLSYQKLSMSRIWDVQKLRTALILGARIRQKHRKREGAVLNAVGCNTAGASCQPHMTLAGGTCTCNSPYICPNDDGPCFVPCGTTWSSPGPSCTSDASVVSTVCTCNADFTCTNGECEMNPVGCNTADAGGGCEAHMTVVGGTCTCDAPYLCPTNNGDCVVGCDLSWSNPGPDCTPSSAAVSGTCTCNSGYTCTAGACAIAAVGCNTADAGGGCEAHMTVVGGTCTCDAPYLCPTNNGDCVVGCDLSWSSPGPDCTPSSAVVSGTCTCNSGYTCTAGACVVNPPAAVGCNTADAGGGCEAHMTVVGGTCTCDAPYLCPTSNAPCVVGCDLSWSSSGPDCTPSSAAVSGTCTCNSGYTCTAGACVVSSPAAVGCNTADAGGGCEAHMTVVSGTCTCDAPYLCPTSNAPCVVGCDLSWSSPGPDCTPSSAAVSGTCTCNSGYTCTAGACAIAAVGCNTADAGGGCEAHMTVVGGTCTCDAPYLCPTSNAPCVVGCDLSWSSSGPDCTPSSAAVSGTCTCNSGYTCTASACVVNPPAAVGCNTADAGGGCEAHMTVVGGTCTCDAPYLCPTNNGDCVVGCDLSWSNPGPDCTPSSAAVSGTCTCNSGYTCTAGACAIAAVGCNTADAGGGCEAHMTVVGGTCTCDAPYLCPTNDGDCVVGCDLSWSSPGPDCTPSSAVVSGTCTCNSGYTCTAGACVSTPSPVGCNTADAGGGCGAHMIIMSGSCVCENDYMCLETNGDCFVSCGNHWSPSGPSCVGNSSTSSQSTCECNYGYICGNDQLCEVTELVPCGTTLSSGQTCEEGTSLEGGVCTCGESGLCISSECKVKCMHGEQGSCIDNALRMPNNLCECTPSYVCAEDGYCVSYVSCDASISADYERCHSDLVQEGNTCRCGSERFCETGACYTKCNMLSSELNCHRDQLMYYGRCRCVGGTVCFPDGGCENAARVCGQTVTVEYGQYCIGAEANAGMCVCDVNEVCSNGGCRTRCDAVSSGSLCVDGADAASWPRCTCRPGRECIGGACVTVLGCNRWLTLPSEQCGLNMHLTPFDSCRCNNGYICKQSRCEPLRHCNEPAPAQTLCGAGLVLRQGKCVCGGGLQCSNSKCRYGCGQFRMSLDTSCTMGAGLVRNATDMIAGNTTALNTTLDSALNTTLDTTVLVDPYICECYANLTCHKGACVSEVIDTCDTRIVSPLQECAAGLVAENVTCRCPMGAVCLDQVCRVSCTQHSRWKTWNTSEEWNITDTITMVTDSLPCVPHAGVEDGDCRCDEGFVCSDTLCVPLRKCEIELPRRGTLGPLRPMVLTPAPCVRHATDVNGTCLCGLDHLCHSGACVMPCNMTTDINETRCTPHSTRDDNVCQCDLGYNCVRGVCDTEYVHTCSVMYDNATQVCSRSHGLVGDGFDCYCAAGTCVGGTCISECNTNRTAPCTQNSFGPTCTCRRQFSCIAGVCLRDVPCDTAIPTNITHACVPDTYESDDGFCKCSSNYTLCQDSVCRVGCNAELRTGKDQQCVANANSTAAAHCVCSSGYSCQDMSCKEIAVYSCDVHIDATYQRCSSGLNFSTAFAGSCTCDTNTICVDHVCQKKCNQEANDCSQGYSCSGDGLCVPWAVSSCNQEYDNTIQICGGGLTGRDGTCACQDSHHDAVCLHGTCHTPCDCDDCGLPLAFPCVPNSVGPTCMCTEKLVCFRGFCGYQGTQAPPTLAPPTLAPLTLVPPTMAPPTPSPPPCDDDPYGWLEIHMKVQCLQLLRLLPEASFCTRDLNTIFEELPVGAYNLSRVCMSTCDCCHCTPPPYIDECDTYLKTNHSCGRNTTVVDGFCRCTGDTACTNGKCRTMCDVMRTGSDPECVPNTVNDEVQGVCSCVPGAGFTCQNGTCSGGVAGCGQAVNEKGCTDGAYDVAGTCTCLWNMACEENVCRTKCLHELNNATMPKCVSEALVSRPYGGHCVCSYFTTCTSAGTCTLVQPPAPVSFVSGPGCYGVAVTAALSCEDCSHVFLPSEKMCRACDASGSPLSADSVRWVYGDAVWCGAKCSASEIITVGVMDGPFSLGYPAEHHTLGSEVGTDRWYQEFMPTEDGCLSRASTLLSFVCPDGSPLLDGKFCTGCTKVEMALIVLEGGCNGPVLVVGHYLGAGTERPDGLSWVEFKFLERPFLNQSEVYCLMLETYSSCSHVSWAATPTPYGVGGTRGYFENNRWVPNGTLTHGFAVAVKPDVTPAPVDAGRCHTLYTCADLPHTGKVSHGWMPSFKSCVRAAQRVGAPYMTYHTGMRECASYMTCLRRLPSVDEATSLSVRGASVVCEVPEGCLVDGSCKANGFGKEWTTLCERNATHCTLCKTGSTPACYDCEEGYTLSVTDETSCTGVCVSNITGTAPPTCTPPCTCRGEVAYGWCDGRAAGGMHCNGATLVNGACVCPSKQWCDDTYLTEGQCIDGTVVAVPTGWCNQLPTTAGTCKDSGATVECTGAACLCVCPDNANCDLDTGVCMGQFIQCNSYAGNYGFCAYPAFPDPASKICACPKGFRCTSDDNEMKCTMRNDCGGCGQLPCDESQIATMRHAASLTRQYKIVYRTVKRLQAPGPNVDSPGPGPYPSPPYPDVSSPDPGPGPYPSPHTVPSPPYGSSSQAPSTYTDQSTFSPFTINITHPQVYMTYQEKHHVPTTKFCFGPHKIMRWDYDGDGLCKCRGDYKWVCCDTSSGSIDGTCEEDLYNSCIQNTPDPRAGCGEPPSEYGCKEHMEAIWEGAIGERQRNCRCIAGFMCNALYRTCESVPHGVDHRPLAECDKQEVGGGCMFNAFTDSKGVCRCKSDRYKTDQGTWGCQATGRCRLTPTDTCSVQTRDASNYGKCLCDASLQNGFWNGTDCGECLNQWFGPGCTLTCNLTTLATVLPEVGNLPTYLFGTYIPENGGSCECPTEVTGGSSLGFTGTLCNECLAENGKFGDNCSDARSSTTMKWERQFQQFVPVVLGPYKVMSYSQVYISVELLSGDISSLQANLTIFPTYRDVETVFEGTTTTSWASRSLMQLGNDNEMFQRQPQQKSVDLTVNDTTTNCINSPNWPASGLSGECYASVPRGYSYAAIKLISDRELEVGVKVRLVTDCCNAHGFCGEDIMECTCAANADLGYWSASQQCKTCDKGYSGSSCTEFTATFDTRMTTLPGAPIAVPVLGQSSYYSVEVAPTTPYNVSLAGKGDCDLAVTLSSTCGTGWTEYKGTCYHLATSCNASFEEARDACSQMGASLLRLEKNTDLLFFLASFMGSLGPVTDSCPHTKKVWTDMTRSKQPDCSGLLESLCVHPCMWDSDTHSCKRNMSSTCAFDPTAWDSPLKYNHHTEDTCNKVGRTFTHNGKVYSKDCFWNKLANPVSQEVTGQCADGECTTVQYTLGAGACEPQYTFLGSFDEKAVLLASSILLEGRVGYNSCVPETYSGAACTAAKNTPVLDSMGRPLPVHGKWVDGAGCIDDFGFESQGECGGVDNSNLKSLICNEKALDSFSCGFAQERHGLRGHEGFPWYDVTTTEPQQCYICTPTEWAKQEYSTAQWTTAGDIVKNCIAFGLQDDMSVSEDDPGFVGYSAYCTSALESLIGHLSEEEQASWGHRDTNIFRASYICEKPRDTKVSGSERSLIHPTEDLEDFMINPTCYNPEVYVASNDVCTGVVPKDANYLAIRVTCLEPASLYNLSMSFVSGGHYYRGSDPPCINSDSEGHWMGTFCSECMPRWSGPECTVFEHCFYTGDCRHGRCTETGYCECDPDWYGMLCDSYCNSTTCLNGGSCNPEFQVCNSSLGFPLSCPSYDLSPLCVCEPGFAGVNCETCTSGKWGKVCDQSCVCNSQGCNAVTGTCECVTDSLQGFWSGSKCEECAKNYYGADCTKYCLPSSTCSGHGNCTKSGSCSCDVGYYSHSCSTKCTVALCTGHGACDATTGACICDLSYSKGFWGGKTCNTCAAGYYGTACKQDCQCAMHGTCDAATSNCRCYDDDKNGHWSGTKCTDCKDGYVGVECLAKAQVSENNLARVAKLSVTGADRSVKYYTSLAGAAVTFSTGQWDHLLAGAGSDVSLFRRPRTSAKLADWEYIGTCNLLNMFGYGSEIIGAVLHKGMVYVGLQGAEKSALVPFVATEPLDIIKGRHRQDQCSNITANSVVTDFVGDNYEQRLVAMALDDRYDSIYTVALRWNTSDALVVPLLVLSRIMLDTIDTDDWSKGASHPMSASLPLPMMNTVSSIVVNYRDSVTNKPLDNPFLFVMGTSRSSRIMVLKVFMPTSGLLSIDDGSLNDLRPVYNFQPGFCSQVPCETIAESLILRGWLYLAVQTWNKNTNRRTAVLGRIRLDMIKDRSASSYGYTEVPESWSGTEMGIGFMVLDANTTNTREETKQPEPFPSTGNGYQACKGKRCGDTCVACEPSSTLCVETQEKKYCTAKGNCVPDMPSSCLTSAPTYIYLGLKNSTPSILYKYKVDELKNTFHEEPTQLTLNYENIATQYQAAVAAVADPGMRLLYVVTKLNRLQVSVVNLYDVQKLSPVYVDGTGGTLVTVKGSGFPLNLNQSDKSLAVSCKWGDFVYKGSPTSPTATLIDSETVICKAPKKSQFDACADVPLEVSIENEARFSSNGILVRHINAAIIFSLAPLRGTLKSTVIITLSGTGFLNSPYLACLVNNVVTKATWKSSISMWCTHPMTDTPAVTTVEVTLDGQKYSESKKPYYIVGAPTQMAWTIGKSSTMGKTEAYTFPSKAVNDLLPLDIKMLDSAGNEVGSRDDAVRDYNISMYLEGPPPSRTLPCVSGPCGTLNGLVSSPIFAGAAQFQGLYLDYPGAGSYKIIINVIRSDADCRPLSTQAPIASCLGLVAFSEGAVPTPIASAEITFEITALASTLKLVTSPPRFSTNKAKLSLQPILVFTDVSDNIATTHSGRLNIIITPNEGAVKLSGTQGDRSTVEYKDGRVTYFNLRILEGVEGQQYVLRFVPDTDHIKPVASDPIYIAVCASTNNAISSIQPDNGQLGRQLVTIKGWNYREENSAYLHCKYGDDYKIQATFVDTCTMLCPLQAKTGPRSAPLKVTLDESGVWYDFGFNYSYIDVVSELTWSVDKDMLSYPSSSIVVFNDILITLRDVSGNWLRSWDTVSRTVYLKTRVNLGSGAVQAVVSNGQVLLKGLRSQLPKEDKYIFLFTTDANAPMPADLSTSDRTAAEVVTMTLPEVEITQSIREIDDRYELLPTFILEGTSLLSFDTLVLPADATAQATYIRLASSITSTEMRFEDMVECAMLCTQHPLCAGWYLFISTHQCYFVSYVRNVVADANGFAGKLETGPESPVDLPFFMNSCAPRNCSEPDASGLYTCHYQIPDVSVPTPMPTPISFTATLTESETQTYVNLSFWDAVDLMNASVASVTQAPFGEHNESSAEAKILDAAVPAYLNNMPVDGCVPSSAQDCPLMSAVPSSAVVFSTTLIITVSEGQPHHMTFVSNTKGMPLYSTATTNRRTLDIQPIVLVVDIAENEVNSYIGAPTVAAVVKPYCVRSPSQTLEEFRYPLRAANKKKAGCLQFLTEEDLEYGVAIYGKTYGPSCHGTAPSGKEAEFQLTCERLRGANVWVENARAVFTELHFRGCASDMTGLPCATDVRYRIHFKLEGAGTTVPDLISDSIYTANCPKSNAPLSAIIPAWAKLVGGATVTLKGWDFQPQRKLRVNLGGVALTPEFIDTCTAIVTVPGATAAREHETLEREAKPLAYRESKVLASFDNPSAASLKVYDEDNPDFESEPLAFQIKSSLPESVGLAAASERNESIPSDSIVCGEETGTSRASSLPRMCFKTGKEVRVGELMIILKDGAGGDLYAKGTYLDGENFGFFEEVTNPSDPNGANVWGREFPGSLDQARDVFITIEVEPPTSGAVVTVAPINTANSIVNMTETGGEGTTTDGLLSITDVVLFYPKSGEYIFRFRAHGTNVRGNPHNNGGVRLFVGKGSPTQFVISNADELVLGTDGVAAMQPPVKLELLDVANNTLINSDLPASDSGLEVLVTIKAKTVFRHPEPSWSGWGTETPAKENETTVYFDNIPRNIRWQTKVDMDKKLFPLGVPLSSQPLYFFQALEMGGEAYPSPVLTTVTGVSGEIETVSLWHQGPSLSKASAAVAIGVEFKDQKVQGLWHGVEYEVTYSFSLPGYRYLGTKSHNMYASKCSEGQFAVNFSSLCTDCPAGATCDSKCRLVALPPRRRCVL